MLAMMTTQLPELLAPVGNFASLQAAIQAKADAVYFGIAQLNMRAKNSYAFTLDDLKDIADIVKSANMRAYVTLNTIIYDDELDQAKGIIDAVKRENLDGVIVSDMAALAYCKEQGVEAHISTQLSVSNIEAVTFFSHFADRIVLARELTLEKINYIIQEINKRQIKGPSGRLMEIELFTHGAMCVAVSGRCYMSLYKYNQSANRGSCIQPCRRQYKVTDIETGKELVIDNQHVMSPKDLNTLPFLDKLVEAGVDVLKIEGRTRSPEYVLIVIQAYRKALTAIADKAFNQKLVDELNEELKKVYNRGYSDGFYLGYNPEQWTEKYGSHATYRKIYCAKVLHYYNNLKIAHIKIEASDLNLGDKCFIIGPTTGVLEFELNALMVDDQPVSTANQGQEATIGVPDKVRLSDKVFVFREIKKNTVK